MSPNIASLTKQPMILEDFWKIPYTGFWITMEHLEMYSGSLEHIFLIKNSRKNLTRQENILILISDM